MNPISTILPKAFLLVLLAPTLKAEEGWGIAVSKAKQSLGGEVTWTQSGFCVPSTALTIGYSRDQLRDLQQVKLYLGMGGYFKDRSFGAKMTFIEPMLTTRDFTSFAAGLRIRMGFGYRNSFIGGFAEGVLGDHSRNLIGAQLGVFF